jgi:hypothetical protein
MRMHTGIMICYKDLRLRQNSFYAKLVAMYEDSWKGLRASPTVLGR